MSHQSFFDMCVLLTGPDDQEELNAFRRTVQAARWPFGSLQLRPLLRVEDCPAPAGWLEGEAAWVRLQSHGRLLEDALTARVQRLLVVEAGVRFTASLREQWSEVVAAAGPNWSLMRLYGGTAHTPLAYAVQGRSIRKLYRALRVMQPSGDLLTRMASLGQRSSKTNIEIAHVARLPREVPFVVVLGPSEEGARLAGALHHVGVLMGGSLEDPVLNALCEGGMPRPELRARFELHARERQALASSTGVVGAWSARLHELDDVLLDVLGPRLRLILLLPASHSDVLLAQPHHPVELGRLQSAPRETVRNLVEWLELPPDPAAEDAALAHLERPQRAPW